MHSERSNSQGELKHFYDRYPPWLLMATTPALCVDQYLLVKFPTLPRQVQIPHPAPPVQGRQRNVHGLPVEALMYPYVYRGRLIASKVFYLAVVSLHGHS